MIEAVRIILHGCTDELPPTKLGVVKVTQEGHMTKTLLDVGNGKLPLIIASGDKVGVVWNTNDGIVKFAPIEYK